MAEYDNTNRGALFKNDRKEQDSHPDYKGQININGQEFWLSAWIKYGAKGKFMSLSVKPKEEQAPTKAASKKQDHRFADLDSDIPF